MKRLFDFVEGGYFTALLFALLAFLGLMIGTGFMTKAPNMNTIQIITTVVLTIGGGFASFPLADSLRKRIYEWEKSSISKQGPS